MEENKQPLKTGDRISFSIDSIEFQRECFLSVVELDANTNTNSSNKKNDKTLVSQATLSNLAQTGIGQSPTGSPTIQNSKSKQCHSFLNFKRNKDSVFLIFKEQNLETKKTKNRFENEDQDDDDDDDNDNINNSKETKDIKEKDNNLSTPIKEETPIIPTLDDNRVSPNSPNVILPIQPSTGTETLQVEIEGDDPTLNKVPDKKKKNLLFGIKKMLHVPMPNQSLQVQQSMEISKRRSMETNINEIPMTTIPPTPPPTTPSTPPTSNPSPQQQIQQTPSQVSESVSQSPVLTTPIPVSPSSPTGADVQVRKIRRKTSEHKSGDLIHYQEKVFFQNFNGKYLGIVNDQNNQTFVLRDELDEDCYFLFTSNYQDHGPVLNNDTILISHIVDSEMNFLELVYTDTSVKVNFKDYGEPMKINLSNDISVEINAISENEHILISHRDAGYISVVEEGTKLLFTNKNKVTLDLYDSLFELVKVTKDNLVSDQDEDLIFALKSCKAKMYLSIQDSNDINNNPVILVDNYKSKSSKFKFIPRPDSSDQSIIYSTKTLFYNQHYYIQSLSDQYLHFQPTLESSNFVGHTQQLKFDDFQIKQPPFESFDKCKNLIAKIDELRSMREEGEIKQQVVDIMKFCASCKSPGEMSLLKNVLLKNTEGILQLFNHANKNSQTKVIIQIYKFLSMMSKDSAKYGSLIMNYFHSFRNVLKPSNRIKIYFIKVLISIYSNHRVLLETLTSSRISEFLDILNGTEKEDRYLPLQLEVIKLLNSLCVCDNILIPKNQQIITRLLQSRPKSQELFLDFKIEKLVDQIPIPQNNPKDASEDSDVYSDDSDEFEGIFHFINFKKVFFYGSNKNYSLKFLIGGETELDSSDPDDDKMAREKEFAKQSLLLYCNLISGGVDGPAILTKKGLTLDNCKGIIDSSLVHSRYKSAFLYFMNMFPIPMKNDHYLDINYQFNGNSVGLTSRIEKVMSKLKPKDKVPHVHPLSYKRVDIVTYEYCDYCTRSIRGHSTKSYVCIKCEFVLCDRCFQVSKSKVDTSPPKPMKPYMVLDNIHSHPLYKVDEHNNYYGNEMRCDICSHTSFNGYHCDKCQYFDICNRCFELHKDDRHNIEPYNHDSVLVNITEKKNPFSTFFHTSYKEGDFYLQVFNILKNNDAVAFLPFTNQVISNYFKNGNFEDYESHVKYLYAMKYNSSSELISEKLLTLQQKNLYEMFLKENPESTDQQHLDNWKKFFKGNKEYYSKTLSWELPEFYSEKDNRNYKKEEFFKSFIHLLKSQDIEIHLLLKSLTSASNGHDHKLKLIDDIRALDRLVSTNTATILIRDHHKTLVSLLKSVDNIYKNEIRYDISSADERILEYFFCKLQPLVITVLRSLGIAHDNKIAMESLAELFQHGYDILFNFKIGLSYMKQNIEFLIEFSITNGNIERFSNHKKLLQAIKKYKNFQDSIYIDILISFIFLSEPHKLDRFYLQLLSKIAHPSKESAILKNQIILSKSFTKFQRMISHHWIVSKNIIVQFLKKSSPDLRNINNNNNNNDTGKISTIEEENKIHNTLSFMKLLSACCAGESSEAEMVARKFISMSDCVDFLVELSNDIIDNADTPANKLKFEFQKTYIFFLYEVYFNTKILLKFNEIPKNIVKLFYNFHTLMNHLCSKSEKLVSDQKSTLKTSSKKVPKFANASSASLQFTKPIQISQEMVRFMNDMVVHYMTPLLKILKIHLTMIQEESVPVELETQTLINNLTSAFRNMIVKITPDAPESGKQQPNKNQNTSKSSLDDDDEDMTLDDSDEDYDYPDVDSKFRDKTAKYDLIVLFCNMEPRDKHTFLLLSSDCLEKMVEWEMDLGYSRFEEVVAELLRSNEFNDFVYIPEVTFSDRFSYQNSSIPREEEYILDAIQSKLSIPQIAKLLKFYFKSHNTLMVSKYIDVFNAKLSTNENPKIRYYVIETLFKILKHSTDAIITSSILKVFNTIFLSQSYHDVLENIKFNYKLNPDNNLFKSLYDLVSHSNQMLKSYYPPTIDFLGDDIGSLPDKLQFCTQVFTFIGSLCRGNDNFIQQNILFQPQSYNIYSMIVEFLVTLTDKIKSTQSNLHYYLVATSFFSALKEISKYNNDNQVLLSNSKVTSCIYQILDIGLSVQTSNLSSLSLITHSETYNPSRVFCVNDDNEKTKYKRKFIFALLKKTIMDFLIKRVDCTNPKLVKLTIRDLQTSIIHRTAQTIKHKSFIDDFKHLDDKLKDIDEINYKKELRTIFFPGKFTQEQDYRGKDFAVCKFLSIKCCYFIQGLVNYDNSKYPFLLEFHSKLLNSLSDKIGRVELIYNDVIEPIYYPIPYYIHKREIKEEKPKSKTTIRAETILNKIKLSENNIAKKLETSKISIINPHNDELQKDIEEYFYDQKVDWEQPTEKINSFMTWSKFTLFKIENRNIFIHNSKWKRFFVNIFSGARLAAFFLAIAINIFLLVYSKSNIGSIDDDLGTTYNRVINVLSAIHIVISVLTLISFVFKYTFIQYKRELPSWKFIQEQKRKNNNNDDEETVANAHVDFAKPNDFSLVFNLYCFYYILAVVFSILGTVYNPFFFSFHIFQYSLNTSALSVIIKEVSKHTKTLAILFVFLVQTAYLMSIFSYLFFRFRYEDGDNNPYCSTLAQCFVSNLYYAIISGGSVIDTMKFETFSEQSNNQVGEITGWIVFNLLFWIIVTIVLLNVILGIIVDALGNMRDKKSDLQKYKNSNCFMCSINRDSFQKNELDFEYHIEIEHNKWNYLYYYEYLKNRNRYFIEKKLKADKINPRKRMEMYFYEMICEGRHIKIFPIEKSLSINNKQNK
ncbi:inositol 1 [Tieghemostelium lacteum]|uniref:Inositol 1 n=1 Tax=Tieghemostelium lacteum TaxID=361077 RepID=A0A152A0K1_TIELA|nr:inositol 1 [Tieghemostelium lacteum]|eukprot:KYQ99781.1 inositol 1 [Tieghemostelium lacteum]